LSARRAAKSVFGVETIFDAVSAELIRAITGELFTEEQRRPVSSLSQEDSTIDHRFLFHGDSLRK
jgi:hypothetical protein